VCIGVKKEREKERERERERRERDLSYIARLERSPVEIPFELRPELTSSNKMRK
jgi:hypothetical protein